MLSSATPRQLFVEDDNILDELDESRILCGKEGWSLSSTLTHSSLVQVQGGAGMPVGLGSRDPRSIKTLHHFLVKFRSQVSGDYLICRKDGFPLGPRAIQHILRRIGKRAGVKVSPHLLRHSAGTFWIRSGGNGLETSGSKLVHLTRVIL